MINSKLVNAANAEAQSPTATLDSIVIPRDILPSEKTQPSAFNVLFKLNKKKNGRYWLDNCCDPVPNPENNNIPERMWLLAGASDVWESKVENILKDKNRYDRARRGMDIMFIDGVCMVRSSDILRLKFLRNHIKNCTNKRTGAGKFDFYEYNPAIEQQERHQKQLLKIEMVIKAKELPIEYAKKLASFLGISFVDDLGMPKSDDGIRTELMLKADTDPATFQKYIDSTEVEVSYLVKRAIIDMKIDLGGTKGSAIWSNGKGFIAKIPSTRKPYEYLTELALTNSDDGRRFLEQLKTIVK